MTPKQRYVAALKRFAAELEEIDKDTPWQEVEPKWWLSLSEIRRMLYSPIRAYSDYGTGRDRIPVDDTQPEPTHIDASEAP